MSLHVKRCPKCKGRRKVRNLLWGYHKCQRCDGSGEVVTWIGRLEARLERRVREKLEDIFGAESGEDWL